ncbi:MAG: CAP-associated domain-containing protein [Clostridiales bacterium]
MNNKKYTKNIVNSKKNSNQKNMLTNLNSDIINRYKDSYKKNKTIKKFKINKSRQFLIAFTVIIFILVFVLLYNYVSNRFFLDKNSNTATEKNVISDITPNISTNKPEQVSKSNIENIIGVNNDKIKSFIGDPDRKDKNEYNHNLFIYNKDFNNFMMIGNNENKCTSFFTSSDNYKLFNSIKIGTSKETCEKILENEEFKITKEIDNIWINDNFELDLFFDSELNTLSCFQISILPKIKPLTFDEKTNDDELNLYLEKQMFDIINMVRLKNKKIPLKLSEEATKVAKNHCNDMISNKYFSHEDKNGNKPIDRLKSTGLEFNKVAENISAGHRNSIFVVETLMQSKEYKNNILGDFNNIGIGIMQGGEYKIYFTQVYFSK